MAGSTTLTDREGWVYMARPGGGSENETGRGYAVAHQLRTLRECAQRRPQFLPAGVMRNGRSTPADATFLCSYHILGPLDWSPGQQCRHGTLAGSTALTLGDKRALVRVAVLRHHRVHKHLARDRAPVPSERGQPG